MRVCGYKYHNQARCREQATTMTCPCGCGKPTKPGGNKYHNREHYLAHRQAKTAKAKALRAQRRKGQLLEAIGGYRDGIY